MTKFNNVILVREDAVGQGSPLLFPGMSSCAAVVAVVGNTLYGAHFTLDPWTDKHPKRQTRDLLDRLKTAIGDKPVAKLLIVGFNSNHNPSKLREDLDVDAARCLAYDIARKHVRDLLLVFSFQDAGLAPIVQWKRTPKVTTNFAKVKDFKPSLLKEGWLGSAEITGSLHTLRRHFVNAA